MPFKERIVHIGNGKHIFTESIGNPDNPAIILIMGAMNPGIFWYDAFCEKLSANGFFVIRYDHRDTGKSSLFNFEDSSYDLNDLTGDVINILDSYKLKRTHIIGLSMGGFIAQLLAVKYSERIASLTLISTSADHRPYMDATMRDCHKKYELPYPKKIFQDYILKGKELSFLNQTGIQEYILEGWQIMLGGIKGDALKEIAKIIDLLKKSNSDSLSKFNHGLAVDKSRQRTTIVKNINAPTFIFHGQIDPCFPVEHGIMLNKLIPHSKLEIVEGMGHMFTLKESEVLAEKITGNIKSLSSDKFPGRAS